MGRVPETGMIVPLTDENTLYTTTERMGPVEYCRIYCPDVTIGGGLVSSLYVEVKREHYEPIEDEL
jgi:hypothetical protein